MTTATKTATRTWTIDPAHSIAEFAVKHMVLTTVKGRFRELEGTLHIDEARPEDSSVSASVDVASIDTGVGDRDAHLRSDDFFNAEKYPKITFRSRRVEPGDGAHFKLVGDLTIRDVTGRSFWTASTKARSMTRGATAAPPSRRRPRSAARSSA